MKWSSAFMLLGSGLFLVLMGSGCSPKTTVNKYSYLLTERKAAVPVISQGVRPEVPTSRPVVAAEAPVSTPVQTGRLSSLPPRPDRRHLQQQEIIISTARSYIGTPYRYGGMSRLGVDCSGLICLAYQAANQPLPRTSKAMSESGTVVHKEQLEPGHLVFFDSKNGHNINHVGMVVATAQGTTEFIHATSSSGVRIDKLEDPYWNRRYRKAVAP